ncbi:MAG: regulatory protein RecX [Glaciecola sp.]|jgi:regulatory protein
MTCGIGDKGLCFIYHADYILVHFEKQMTDVEHAFTEPDDRETKQQLRHKITRLLARREHSYAELVQKLSNPVNRDDFPNELILEVLQQFVDKDIQSDARFTYHFIRNGLAKGQGWQRIKQAASPHNLDNSLLQATVEELDIDWFEHALAVKIKKFGEEVEQDFTKRQKQMRFLQYRGFSHDEIAFAVTAKPI